jgi:glycosyltransferase involved in cell wall biosynthesis
MVIQRFRPSFGGQGVQLESLCAALATRGIEATVYTANPGDAAAVETSDGYRVRRLRADVGGKGPHWPAFGARVHRALRHDRPELVHVHGLTDALYAGWLYCRAAAAPLVFEMTLLGVDEPGAIDRSTARLRWLRRRLYRQADAYVAMSKAFAPSYAASGLPAERFHVIPQGVDTARFRPDPTRRTSVRTKLELAPDAPVVVFVGSLIERKGIDVLLRAWPEVHAQYPGAILLLAGPGDLSGPAAAAAWAAMSDEVHSSVRCLGRRDDVEDLLAAADAFVFPSRREGFGTVIIEAMATGLPCVVAQLPGITDYIFEHPASPTATTTEADGIVVPQESPEQVAAALSALLAAPKMGRSIGAQGRERVRAGFELESVANQYVALYEALLETGR